MNKWSLDRSLSVGSLLLLAGMGASVLWHESEQDLQIALLQDNDQDQVSVVEDIKTDITTIKNDVKALLIARGVPSSGE